MIKGQFCRFDKGSGRERDWLEPGFELGTPLSATSLYVGPLPTRLSALTLVLFLVNNNNNGKTLPLFVYLI